jgi:DNA modification methylase
LNDQGSFAEIIRETGLIDKEQAQLALLSEATPQKRTIRAPHKRANELDGQTWTKYSISIWSDIKKTPEEAALGHPAMFPLELPRRLLRCFTAQEETIVLDPFVGLGSTILAAEELGKTGIGLDIYPSFVKKAQERLAQLRLPTTESQPASNPRSRFHCVDARYLRRVVPIDSVDIVITSPPYWDILMQERSADRKSTRHYGESEADLGRIGNYQKFLESLRDAFEPVHTVLKAGKYCIVIVMDIRKKSTLYPFHSDVVTMMRDIGFLFDDLIIWDRRHEYNNMRPLGFPYRFRINKAHEYILIFRKSDR